MCGVSPPRWPLPGKQSDAASGRFWPTAVDRERPPRR